QLTAAQADAVVSQAQLIAVGSSDLAWLTDSLQLVIHSGTSVQPVTIQVGAIQRDYFAVALVRNLVNDGTTKNSNATWDMLAFDDLSLPSKFIVIGGFAGNATTTPPEGVVGNFGPNASGHIIEITNGFALDWAADVGSAAFQAGPKGAACEGFTPFNNVTCFGTTLDVSFTITNSVPPSLSLTSRNASMGKMTLPGILLRIDTSF